MVPVHTTDAPPSSDAATHVSTAPEDGFTATLPDRRGVRMGIRARILFWSILTLALSVAMGVVAVRQVVRTQIDGRIDESLRQEARELELLAGGNDPRTGRPFGNDVERIFDVFLARNVPQRNEAYLTFVGGVAEDSRGAMPHALDEDGAFLARVDDVRSSARGAYESTAGRVEYLAVPVLEDGRPRGAFVSAYFADLEVDDAIRQTTRTAIEVGVLMLLIGALVIWRVAEGVLKPVRRTTETVRDITTADLSRRLAVSGNDEVADLGRTFNELLAKLEDAFETQRRFVDDAGHELRTPITIIRGHLELLDDDPAERERTLALVGDELGRMQRIVEDLLTLAKAERPDFLAMEAVEIGSLTDELVEKVSALGERSWQIDARARGIVVADRQRLSQAMIQLVHNAVQHTDVGATIALGSELRGSEARLWVRDAGRGIAPQEMGRIFQRFARGEGRRASEGAGLGLSIVRAIAEAHGGRVELDSAVGIGSTFAVVLPIDQPVAAEATP
jgi:two-component system OmpR family sensor kinase